MAFPRTKIRSDFCAILFAVAIFPAFALASQTQSLRTQFTLFLCTDAAASPTSKAIGAFIENPNAAFPEFLEVMRRYNFDETYLQTILRTQLEDTLDAVENIHSPKTWNWSRDSLLIAIYLARRQAGLDWEDLRAYLSSVSDIAIEFLPLWFSEVPEAMRQVFIEGIGRFNIASLVMNYNQVMAALGAIPAARSKIYEYAAESRIASVLLAGADPDTFPTEFRERYQDWLVDKRYIDLDSTEELRGLSVELIGHCPYVHCHDLERFHSSSTGFKSPIAFAPEANTPMVKVYLRGIFLGTIKLGGERTFLAWRTVRAADGSFPLITGAAYLPSKSVAVAAEAAHEANPDDPIIELDVLSLRPVRFAYSGREHARFVEYLISNLP